MAYRLSRGRIFTVVADLHEQGKPLDAVTLAAELGRLGAIDDVGGRDFILSLPGLCPAAANVRQYAEAVRAAADKRAQLRAVRALEEALGCGDDAAAEKAHADLEAASSRVRREPLLTRLDSLPMKAVEWLWPRRVPRGMPSMFFGDPGLGKSHIAIDMASRVTNGCLWPDGGHAPQGNVVFLTAEDDWQTVLIPRLTFAGADLSRIYGFASVACFSGHDRRTFWIKLDAAKLEREIQRVGAVMAVVDPLSAYLDGVDSHKVTDVRAALSIVADLAERTGAAIVCIMHPNKDDNGTAGALNRLSGSGAFGAAPRSVMAVAPDANRVDESKKMLLPVKLNIGRKPDGLGFRITSASPDTCESGILWDDEPVEVDADEAFGKRRADTPAMTTAMAFLQAPFFLAGGEPYPSKVLEEEAAQAGIALATLELTKTS